MDWKILVVLVVGLGIFFAVQQCSDEDPDFDRIRAQERAERASAHELQKLSEAATQRNEAREEARKQRGDRPEARTAVLETDVMRVELTTRGGALLSVKLKDPQYLEAPRDWQSGLRDEEAELVPVDLVTTNTSLFEYNSPLRFEVYQGLDQLLPDADYELREATASSVTFAYSQPGLPIEIVKKYEVPEGEAPYTLWMTVRVVNRGAEEVAFHGSVVQQGYQHKSETEGGIFSQQPNLMNGICRYGDTVFREPWTSDELEAPFSGVGGVEYVGVETNYFLGAMVPGDDAPTSCFVKTVLDPAGQWGLVRSELRWGEVRLAAGEARVFRVKNYLGPKRYQLLQAIGHRLETSVDFGVFAPICKVLLWLLFAFQSVVNNWGVAIILLTVLVKVALIPLTHRSFKSADRMKALKPQVDEINERHKDDAAAKQQATMALYKKNGVNPLGGCLPTLLQMPIWFALFRTLRASPELYRAEFFGWIQDLSAPDPYFVTPLIMGAAMFLQQRFTPMTGDSAQAKMMMYFMPVMFTGMMLFLPSGLTLYILVNTVLSIAHQMIIHRRSAAGTAPAAAKGGDKAKKARKKR